MSAQLKPKWTQNQAVDLATAIEQFAPDFGAHVALTGGTLYKAGPRKDCDILLYRVRQVTHIDTKGLFKALKRIGLKIGEDHGWCIKATYEGKSVDLLLPERDGEITGSPRPDISSI